MKMKKIINIKKVMNNITMKIIINKMNLKIKKSIKNQSKIKQMKKI